MSIATTIIPILFVVFAIVASFIFASKRGGMGAKVEEMNRELFSRTGYRHAAIHEQPLEAQLAFSAAHAQKPLHLIRPLPQLNTQLHFRQETKAQGARTLLSASWSVPLRPAFGFHLIDKKLMGARAVAKNVMTSMHRTVCPAFPTEVTVAIPALGDRFKLFATDPARAMSVLMQPDVQQLVMAMKSVELLVSEGDISLNDPMMENLHPPGGPMALAGMQPAQMGEFMAGAHDRAAQLLVAVASKVG